MTPPVHEHRDRALYARLAAHAVRRLHPEASAAEQRRRVRDLLNHPDHAPQQ